MPGKRLVVEDLFRNTVFPFTVHITNFPLPEKFKVPHMLLFDGNSDPIEHLETYQAHLSLHGTQDKIACWAFKDNARDWFGRLLPNSINNFDSLVKEFLSQFIVGSKCKNSSTYLFTVKQRQAESLEDYIIRFNHKKLTVDDPKED